MKCHVRTKRCGKKQKDGKYPGQKYGIKLFGVAYVGRTQKNSIRPGLTDQYMFVEIFLPSLDTKFGMFCASESEKQSLHCDEAAGGFQLRVASCLH